LEPLWVFIPVNENPVAAVNTSLPGFTGATAPEKRRRFGEPEPPLVTTPVVAAATRAALTPAGVRVGLAPRSIAAAPATWGAAIEVPWPTAVAVLLVFHDDTMLTPGAKRSRQEL
jgi:hypothetical protein